MPGNEKKCAAEEKEKKRKKKTFVSQPAMQNSVKMSLHVVNVSLQMKTYWIQVYTNRIGGFFRLK